MSDNLIFISYRSTDSAKVDTIVSRLRTLQADGKPKYKVWQDKTDIQPADDWWLSIVNAIRACKVFVFMVSAESVVNVNCRAELAFARKLNKHIVPMVLNNEFFHNPTSGKNDIRYWGDVPDELNDIRVQFLFDEGAGAFQKLDSTLERCIANPKPELYADNPPDPRHVNDATNNTASIYEEAYELAWKLDFDTAERRFQRLLDLQDRHFGAEAREWILILRDYRQLIEFDSRKASQFKVKGAWQTYLQERTGKEFLPDGLFDPKDFKSRYDGSQKIITPTRKSSLELLPKPFAWIPIPEGKVTIGKCGYLDKDTTFTVPAFEMAKYPCTNAQFKLFMDAGGYDEKRWWTDDGWQAKLDGWDYQGSWKKTGKAWTQPRFLGDDRFKGDDKPIIGVSWHEAVAFCTWLSETTGENIMLPTEQQWQRAAQGDKGLIYPWGNEWYGSRCNNSVVSLYDSNQTTPVRQYEGKGDSPFGVTDMSGNVWEWCLTAYETGETDLYRTDVRVLRGGSWNNYLTSTFRAVNRIGINPHYWDNDLGFRFALSYNS